MVQEVLVANRHSSFEGLWLEHHCILIVTVQLDILVLLPLINGLQLIGLESRVNIRLLLLALVAAHFVVVFRRGDELVLLAEVVLLPLFVPDLEDLLLAGRLVDDAGVDRTLLRRLVDEVERVLRLARREVIVLVDLRDQKSPLFIIFMVVVLLFLGLGRIRKFRFSVLLIFLLLLLLLVRHHFLDFPRVSAVEEV